LVTKVVNEKGILMSGSMQNSNAGGGSEKGKVTLFRRVEALRPKAKGVAPEKIAGNVMKAVQFYSPYGYRARIGVIIPGVNVNLEPEFYRVAPKGVSIHTSRMLLLGKATQESYLKMERDTERAAQELATAEVDVVTWACTSGGVLLQPQKIEEKIRQIAGCPAISTLTSAITALKALGAKRVALGTPYVSFINESEIGSLKNAGFKVVSMYGLELGENQEERRGIGRIPPQSLHRFARHIDRPDADVIFISCTNVAGIEEIAQIEAELGKPVITSNLVTIWHALRTVGVNDKIEGFGRLLTKH
jgi:maleate cis-trans isomerase